MPLSPRTVIETGDLELIFEKKLPVIPSFKIAFYANTFTEPNYTEQGCHVILDLGVAKSYQVCTHVLVKDYVGRTVATIASRERGVQCTIKEKGVRIEEWGRCVKEVD